MHAEYLESCQENQLCAHTNTFEIIYTNSAVSMVTSSCHGNWVQTAENSLTLVTRLGLVLNPSEKETSHLGFKFLDTCIHLLSFHGTIMGGMQVQVQPCRWITHSTPHTHLHYMNTGPHKQKKNTFLHTLGRVAYKVWEEKNQCWQFHAAGKQVV